MPINPLVLGSVLEVGKSLIERFFPNEEARRQAEADLIKMAMDGELKQVIAQLEINAREALHPSIFVAGWRPAAGWAGVFGLAYTTIIHPLFSWLASIKGWPAPPPLDTDLLWVVLTGMLGIGGLRTFEKAKGVSK